MAEKDIFQKQREEIRNVVIEALQSGKIVIDTPITAEIVKSNGISTNTMQLEDGSKAFYKASEENNDDATL